MDRPIEFLFDTADADYIDSIWLNLKDLVSRTAVKGITTNPNALSKIGCETLEQMQIVIPNLVSMVTDMRGGEPGGAVHVQIPHSNLCLSETHVLKWAEYISQFSDGCTHIVMKIPHFTAALRLTDRIVAEHGLPVNVTGISDWGTVLKAFAYPNVTYASLITGRMDERGVNANEMMMYLAPIPRHGIQKIIAGSMRTIAGLEDAVYTGLLPTIGARVWDHFFDDSVGWDTFEEIWIGELDIDLFDIDVHWPPLITEDSRALTEEFFKQMDDLGENVLAEFLEMVNISEPSE